MSARTQLEAYLGEFRQRFFDLFAFVGLATIGGE